MAKVLDRGKLPIIKVWRERLRTCLFLRLFLCSSVFAPRVVCSNCRGCVQAEARVDAPSNNSGSGKDSTATTSDEEWPPGCTTVALDISMFVPGHTGLVSSAFVKELVTHLPSLRPLCLVTKQLLKVRRLAHAL